ncbi:hypothetical protein LLH23_19075 [bacterium]|nr:hypothetical protein [bacterium]
MLSRIAQTILVVIVAAGPLFAQTPLRMWYRGGFEGWTELRRDPAPGWYYTPSQNSAYPLNESAYGQPVPCAKCGHTHYPGQDVCPYCGDRCAAGGNDLDPDTVYTQRRLPGQYWYEKQPHYRFSAPMRLRGTYLKYKWPYD